MAENFDRNAFLHHNSRQIRQFYRFFARVMVQIQRPVAFSHHNSPDKQVYYSRGALADGGLTAFFYPSEDGASLPSEACPVFRPWCINN